MNDYQARLAQANRPLSQKEKAAVLGVHRTTVSAMARAGLPRTANGPQTVAWKKENPDFRFDSVYRRRK